MRPFFLTPSEVSANTAYIWFKGYIMPTSQAYYILETSWDFPANPEAILYESKQIAKDFRKDVLIFNVWREERRMFGVCLSIGSYQVGNWSLRPMIHRIWNWTRSLCDTCRCGSGWVFFLRFRTHRLTAILGDECASLCGSAWQCTQEMHSANASGGLNVLNSNLSISKTS